MRVVVGAEFVAELDRALAEAGRTRWMVLVRDRAGACAGGTEVTFEPRDPRTVLQQNTGIDPAHRAVGLAKWAKAAMLERIQHERPKAQRVRINDAIGFKVISARAEWQAEVRDLLRALQFREPATTIRTRAEYRRIRSGGSPWEVTFRDGLTVSGAVPRGRPWADHERDQLLKESLVL